MIIHLLTEKKSIGREFVLNLCQVLCERGHDTEVVYEHAGCRSGDLMFILGYLKIIPVEYLKKHTHNLVIHASNLPKGKGWSPVAWQIIEGSNCIPFTLFEAQKELDAGDIYAQKNLILKGNEVFSEWRSLQWSLICEMVVEFVSNFPNIQSVPQSGESTYYRRRNKKDDEIDIKMPLSESFNKIRVCDPDNYPAWFDYKGRRFEIFVNPVDTV